MVAMRRLFVPLLAALALAGAARAEDKPAAEKPEAQVQKLVAEDDAVRIEETRFRGVTQSIVVKSKVRGGGITYEIRPPSAARDPSQPGQSSAGQRVWSIPLSSTP
jgi:hypothetical protein